MTPNRITRFLATMLVLGAVAIAPVLNHRSATAQSEQIYLALGDSIPAGLLASLPAERSYPALLRDLIDAQLYGANQPGNVELVNLAEPGETIESFIEDGQLNAALSEIEDTADERLRTITLTLGGNNILSLWESTIAERGTALEQFETGFTHVIEELANAISGQNIDVVITTYYDLTEGDASVEGSNAWWLDQFNDVIRETAHAADFMVVDLADAFSGQITDLTWFPGDIHPNNSGHQLIAQSIWRELAYDQDAPAVEITRPDTGESASRMPTIHASVTDDVGVESVVLEIDEEPESELIYVPEQQRWIGIWNAREYSGTEATITVRATDVSGNTASDSVTVQLPTR